MKKLLTSVIASAALLLGFASCSGDLHDNSVQPLTITGLCGAKVVPLELANADGSEQKLTFIYKGDTQINSLDGNPCSIKDGWGYSSGTLQMKLVPQANLNDKYEPNWTFDIGGLRDTPITVEIGKDYSELSYRGKDGNTNPGNITVYDLSENEEYTIYVKYNAATNYAAVKVVGPSVKAPDLQLVTKVLDDSKNAVVKTVTMKRAGTTYTYEFIAAKDIDNFKFYVTAPSLNTYYKVEDGKLSPVALDKEFKQDAHGNYVDNDGNVIFENYVVTKLEISDENYVSASIKKDRKYKIEIKADDSLSGFNGTMKYNVEEVAPFENAQFIGNWKYADTHDGDWAVDSKNSYRFTADRSSYEFYVVRDKEDASMVFGAGTKSVIKPSDKKGVNGEAIELKYVCAKKSNSFAYTENDSSIDTNVDYITVSDLKPGVTYIISLDDSEGVAKTKIAVQESPILHEVVNGYVLAGTMNSWGNTKASEISEDKLTMTFGPFTASGSDEFKIKAESTWDIGYQAPNSDGGPISCNNKKVGEKSEPLTLADMTESGPNIKISGLNAGDEFKIIITIDDKNARVFAQALITKKAESKKLSEIIKSNYSPRGMFNIWAFDDTAKWTEGNEEITAVFGPYTCVDPVNDSDPNNSWKFASSDWSNEYIGGVFKKGVTDEITLSPKGTKNAAPIQLINYNAGDKIKITIRVSDKTNKIYAKVEEVK